MGHDLERALNFIRARPKPLGLYCFTTDEAVANEVLSRTSSGGAVINDVVMHLANPDLPFGGVGESGMGSYHGKRTFDCFSHKKAVLRRTNYLEVSARYPPYTTGKQLLLKLALRPSISGAYARAAAFLGDPKNVTIIML